MNIKRIGLLAIIATLPFGANATEPHIGPDGNWDEDSTDVELATDEPYYKKIEISNDDAEHIATTAYVKGAYNDTLAAINQVVFVSGNAYQPMLQKQSPQGEVPLGLNYVVGKQIFMEDYTTYRDDAINDYAWDESLVTAAAVAKLVNMQRVKIYTTWDDDRDSATTEVSFITASGNN